MTNLYPALVKILSVASTTDLERIADHAYMSGQPAYAGLVRFINREFKRPAATESAKDTALRFNAAAKEYAVSAADLQWIQRQIITMDRPAVDAFRTIYELLSNTKGTVVRLLVSSLTEEQQNILIAVERSYSYQLPTTEQVYNVLGKLSVADQATLVNVSA